jgi:hypothetical protein
MEDEDGEEDAAEIDDPIHEVSVSLLSVSPVCALPTL